MKICIFNYSDYVFILFKMVFGVFKIKVVGYFMISLIYGIIYFMYVYFRNYIKIGYVVFCNY